eukprot:5160892-Pyramimonas_sp.AAC.1
MMRKGWLVTKLTVEVRLQDPRDVVSTDQLPDGLEDGEVADGPPLVDPGVGGDQHEAALQEPCRSRPLMRALASLE